MVGGFDDIRPPKKAISWPPPVQIACPGDEGKEQTAGYQADYV